MYQWSDYGSDLNFTQVYATRSAPDQLSSLRQYLETNSDIHYDSTLSIPFYLGLTTKENVEWLRDYISETYSNLFEEFHAQVSKLSNKNLIEKELLIHPEGWKVSPQISQAIALQLRLSQSNCQNITKRLHCFQKKVEQLQEQLQENSDCSDNSNDDSDA
ncbi:16584_t:CDS:2 [Funneliformis geosporum]|uniref:9882_t:CDS:1 n=1 Tax=Funneliformis geosporum TaxID=1117311 RepID=A0A9W4SXM9_9GLOM|nr:16584_t:CDS:2 [Funneliformis geosporum]CAI2185184.1 9882_t:CDS:2 [Funneliformis geosporum]